jgi:multidrug resistance efflux pump
VNVEEATTSGRARRSRRSTARELEAQVKSGQAALELAESNAKRSDELWKQRIVTALEYERDRAALASAQAASSSSGPDSGMQPSIPDRRRRDRKTARSRRIVSPQTRLFSIATIPRSYRA